jgi:hypothetical protein
LLHPRSIALRATPVQPALASNLRDLSWLKWVMETSLTKTLAAKRQISVRQVYRFRLLLDIVPSRVKIYVD